MKKGRTQDTFPTLFSTLTLEEKFTNVTKITLNAIFVTFLFFSTNLNAQDKVDSGKKTEKNEKATSEKESFAKLKFSGSVQPWFRYTQMNPGSFDQDQVATEESYNVSIRRFRLYGKLSLGERWNFAASVGVNNINRTGKSIPAPQLLDFYGTYKISDAIKVGAGKSAWDGLSRYTAPSTSNMLLTDIQWVTQPTLNITDKIIRNLSAFVYGDLDKFHYRVIVKKPYNFSQTEYTPNYSNPEVAQFTDDFDHPEFTGYFKYDLLDKEPTNAQVWKGTHQGKLKLLSLGFGFKYRQNAMKKGTEGNWEYQDMNLFSGDVFLEYPLGYGTDHVLTTYVGYFNYRMGDNYLRSVGANNPAYGWNNTENIVNGKGNGYPAIGTGESVLLQLGYLLPEFNSKHKLGRLQWYGGGQWSDFEALSKDVVVLSTGFNWHLNAYNTKISLDLQNRPLLTADGLTDLGRKNMVVLQYQYKF